MSIKAAQKVFEAVKHGVHLYFRKKDMTFPQNISYRKKLRRLGMSETGILGLDFPFLTRIETYGRIVRLLNENTCATVFTPNPEMALAAHRDRRLCELLNSASLLIPDGVGIMIASQLLSAPLPCRIPGIEAGEFILSYAARSGLSVFFLGGKEGVAREAAKKMSERYPGLKICGTHHGYFDASYESVENRRITNEIISARPDILFVCLGFPAQEKWIAENAPVIPGLRLAIGLGGSLDVWSGRLRRAPAFMRRTGLEWLWRALREPRRLKILFRIPAFLCAVWRERISKKRNTARING